MKDLRLRPKGNYTWEAQWQQLYTLTEHWKSDLLFYKDDLKFLHHLVNKYFVWILKKENIHKIHTIGKNLAEENKRCNELLSNIDTHLKRLSALIDNPFKYDSHALRSEHEKLEDNINWFIQNFRKHKKETFLITEHAVGKEKSEKFLTA
ncbi:hypothetical protein [Abyssalbus ytuae]|uniref:Uncharacterized protein n=1 Tax=Abyssalbus ytuae TaxID=2926907 RepID=A0A9E6ZN10_9FLAO|nr:hypothetical protein [Abyssalbus ytuae]UOB18899.1 hypothetical protein MQE35_06280 [Abyssalbus ytuae]